MEITTVRCPKCGTPVEWRPANRYRPFCSERCKQLDLGDWASENYRLPSPVSTGDDLDDDATGSNTTA